MDLARVRALEMNPIGVGVIEMDLVKVITTEVNLKMTRIMAAKEGLRILVKVGTKIAERHLRRIDLFPILFNFVFLILCLFAAIIQSVMILLPSAHFVES